MRVLLYLILSCTLMLAGCAGNSLVKNFKDRGVTQASTARLGFLGSENDFGSDISVIIDDRDIITSVWNSIYSSTPAEPHDGSDFIRIDFYTSQKAEWSAATLLVSPNDDAFLDTEFSYQYDSETNKITGLLRCPGLYKLRMQLLKEEFNQRKDSL